MFFFFQAEDGIRDIGVTGVQTCALPICGRKRSTTLQYKVNLKKRDFLNQMNRAFTLRARSKIPKEGNLLSKNSRSQPHREGPAPISYRVLQVGHSNTKNLRSLFSSDYGDSPLNPRSLFSILKVGQGALWVRLSIRAQLGPEPLMSTLRQIEANRRNSEKSTGPTSVTGKAASSMNALKTGIHAKSLVLPSEKVADLEQLIDEYYQHHRPA